tara:strand:+ start:31662 stop:31922 length:261 start_codon:yes stop_codon:yes gene_type:complete
MHNFQEFLEYVESFYAPYHKDVLYPIDGLTTGEIAIAILKYLDLCASTDITWGDGDSLDRERVRDIITEIRAIEDAQNPVRGLNFR